MQETNTAIIRLKSEKAKLGSYRKLAKKYGVNVRYVWELLTTGNIPKSKSVCKKLGISTAALSRTRARNHALDEIAKSWGYTSWSNYETEMIRTYSMK